MASYGCVKDERDDRDFMLAPPGENLVLPDQHDLTASFVQPMDQGAFGTCTGYGTTAAYRYNLLNTDKPDVVLSVAQLYWDAGKLEGNTADVGRQIRDVVKCLATIGVAKENLWTYDKVGQEPDPSVYIDASRQMILEYNRVEVNRAAINTAIFMGHPVIIGIPVFPAFESDEVMGTGIVPMPGAGETEIGRHCMLMGGYDPQWDIVLNSWGTWFGLPEKKGYCKLPRGYLEKYGSDLWTIFLDK